MKTWLQKQDAYTLYRQVRKRFPRNPYSVNILDVFECDLVDVQALSKHNNGYKYLLTDIDVFSKFLHSPSKIQNSKRCQFSISLGFARPKILETF